MLMQRFQRVKYGRKNLPLLVTQSTTTMPGHPYPMTYMTSQEVLTLRVRKYTGGEAGGGSEGGTGFVSVSFATRGQAQAAERTPIHAQTQTNITVSVDSTRPAAVQTQSNTVSVRKNGNDPMWYPRRWRTTFGQVIHTCRECNMGGSQNVSEVGANSTLRNDMGQCHTLECQRASGLVNTTWGCE